ncbi:E3 ubiquitin-protein ligase rififylin [Neosynchiropus ocellatus]
MWASCCTWMCMDSDSDVAASESAGTQQSRRAYTNSAFSSQPSPAPALGCQSCGGRFDTPSRKHVCTDCGKNFCGRCSAQLESRPRLCHTCQRFYGNLLERSELMKLKVKELRDYLHLHQVSTHLCREKEELVELVLSQRSSPSSDSTPETPSSDPPSVTSDGLDTSSTTLDPEPVLPEASVTPQEELQGGDAGGPEEDQVSDSEEPAVPGRRASLSDLSCVGDIEDLSVRQLKEILARNFVNYKGCCEKWELMERVTRLYQDQLVLREGSGEPGSGCPEENLCRICMDSPIDCVLLECGHMITCTKCGKRMSECPICRQYVIRAVHVFRS